MDTLPLLWQATAAITNPELIAIIVLLMLAGMFFNIVLRGKRPPSRGRHD